ncbi:hypothetical protein [Hyphomicrobium facile]|uniref:Uncharacterized protein n=1 Tax=Hyphomicrobium facile TaxID=51670 RepID=A0A1I7NKD6_9HYPH|nr:hypothetical protein [Hyphomicrobium facile]SFV35125.1 hypothetical protein SAMN04488557_2506 [Hyphomicrobium facile]
MAADGQKGNGSDTVRRLRKLRFARPAEANEFHPEQRDLPVFLSASTDEPQADPRADVAPAPVAAGFAETFAKIFDGWSTDAWRDHLSRRFAGLSFERLRPKDAELTARIALILLLVPLAFAFAPSRLPRAAKIEAPNFILEDRLSFAEGLRRQLASQTVSFHPDREDFPAVTAEAATTEEPSAAYEGSAETLSPEETQTAAETATETNSAALPAIVMDERRWSLPFNSQDYAIADLPTSPQASFKTEVEFSSFAGGFDTVAAQNDDTAVGPLVQTKRPAERRKSRVLAYSQRAPRINRPAPVVVETVIVQQEKPALPPLLFFLGNPPPPEEPVVQPEKPPKSEPWLPQSLQDIIGNQY